MCTSSLENSRPEAGSLIFTGVALVATCVALLLAPHPAMAWSNDPTANDPVCTATDVQTDPKMISDGAGGAIITWEDSRIGSARDIYAQRVNSTGAPQWSVNGNGVCTATADQINPHLVSDGAGGAIISWQDTRNGNTDIYAQRVNSSGAAQWTANGIPVCTETLLQTEPKLISDGAGGTIIAWRHRASPFDTDIYVQRVNSSGVVQWTFNGDAVCTASDFQLSHQIISDGAGGAIITWQDQRPPVTHVYAQRVNSSGVAQWAANGVPVCMATGGQYKPQLLSDGAGGAIITWDDNRNSSHDIYAQRVNSSGVAQWTTDGNAVCTATLDQFYPELVSDGAGGAIITWYDGRNGTDNDIYAQRVNSSGATQWTANGIAVCTAVSGQDFPGLLSDGAGGSIITWTDGRNGVNTDMYAQRVDSSGAAQWTANGVAISTATGDQGLSSVADSNKDSIVSNGSAGAIITWVDFRNGIDYDIYASRVTSSGTLSPLAGVSDWALY